MIKKIYSVILISSLSLAAMAGNPDRIGQSGASQLMINPWAMSSGMGWAGQSNVRGLEASFFNMGGLAHAKRTELGFSNTNWLVGSGVQINAFGFAQSLGGEGVLALTVMTMDLGEIEVTTVEQPDGGLGMLRSSQKQYLVAYL